MNPVCSLLLCVMAMLLGMQLHNIDNQQNRIDKLEKEIASMPHYECVWKSTEMNISRSKLINFSPTIEYKDNEFGIFLIYQMIDDGDYKGYLAKCSESTCRLKKLEEVCTLNKDIIQQEIKKRRNL